MSRTVYMVMYEQGKPTGCNMAMHSILDEHDANVMMQDARPTVTRKDGKRAGKYLVMSKRLFEVKNPDGSLTLYIICDCVRTNDKP